MSTALRRIAAASALVLMVLPAAGCTVRSSVAAATSAAAPSSSADTSTGVPRASAADRKSATLAMQAVVDYYKGLWSTAEKFSHYPSDAARQADPAYQGLQEELNKDVITESNEAAMTPFLGKNEDDFNLWSNWQDQMVAEQVQLGAWARGQATAAEVQEPIRIAEYDIARILQ